jgi:hypothetical protein
VGKRFLNLEKLQDDHCDFTRGTNKRFRVLRNVGEAAKYFPIDEPIICIGSGDGFEVEVWKLLGFNAFGCEISTRKRIIAKAFGVTSVTNFADSQGRCNIYCAHTIEHMKQAQLEINNWTKRVKTVICCIFPIEPMGTRNPSHLSPIKSLNTLKFPNMEILLKQERFNDEREGIIIARRNV